MTERWISPKDIVVDLLRVRITDPRGVSRSGNEYAQDFTPDGSTTEFTITPPSGTVSCITSVTLDGTSKIKWTDYFWDARNQKIIFTTAPSGTILRVKFMHGSTDWIYSDKPDIRVKSVDFPRMDILIIPAGGRRMGNYEAPVQDIAHFQVDVYTKPKADDQIFTITTTAGSISTKVTRKMAGEELAEYLAYQVKKTMEEYESDIHPILYDYAPFGPVKDMGYNEIYQCFHYVFEFMLSGIELGRIDM